MTGGWTRDGAVQDQIDETVADAMLTVRASMPAGEGEQFCAICGDDIPVSRRHAIPCSRICAPRQGTRVTPFATAFDRRGGKDSQLR